MKSICTPLLVVISFYSPVSAQESITDEEKATLLSKIESMQQQVVEYNRRNQTTALSDFMAAIQSDRATFDLYMKCKEKVEYDDKKKDRTDTREALRNFEDKASSDFKRALRHQLYWLVHSMEAARNPDKRLEQAMKLVSGLVNIVEDSKKLEKGNVFNGPLKQNPFNSVFAKAYEVDHLKPESWPSSPLDYDGLYEGVILQELIEKGDYAGARSQWANRIKAEQTILTSFAKEPETNKFGDTPVELEVFLEKTKPSLVWKSEQKLWKAGDTRAAAQNLFMVLDQYPKHPQYLKWVEWLKGALSGEEALEEVE